MKAIYLLLLLVGFSYSQIETLLSVPDTSSLKTMSVGLGGAMFLRGYSSSTNNGAGIYIVVDSAYAEGTQAFDHPTRGYQWYLMSNQTLNDSSVTGSKIQSATINTSNLANSSVTTTKIADSSITSAKIATGTITYNNLTSTIKNYVGGGTSFIDVTSIGAVGDNSTDNTTTFRNMIDTYGDSVVYYIPAGTYVTDSIHIVGMNNITFYSNQQNVTFKLSSTASTGIFWVENSHHIDFNGITFDGDSANVSGTNNALIEFTEVDSSDIRGCTFKNADGDGIMLNNCWYNDIYFCDVNNLGGVGIGVGSNSATDTSSYNIVSNCRISNTGTTGKGYQGIFTNIARYTSGTDSIIGEYGFNKFLNNIIEDTKHVGMEIWAANSLVSGNTIRRTGNQTSSAITIGSAPNCAVTSNNLSFFTNAGIECSSQSIGSGKTTISNNIIHHFNGRGIVAGGTATSSVVITGNTIDSLQSGLISSNCGIQLLGGKGLIICSNNTFTRMGMAGIWSNSERNIITNNTFDYRGFVDASGLVGYTNAIELSSAGGTVPRYNIITGNTIIGNDSSSTNYKVYGIDFGTQSPGMVANNIITNCYVGIYSVSDSATFNSNMFVSCNSGFQLDNVTRNPNIYSFNSFINTDHRWNPASSNAYVPQLAEEDLWFGNWGSGADVYEKGDLFRTKKYTSLPDTSGWSSDFDKDGVTFILRTGTADTLMIYDKALDVFHKIGMD